MALQVVCQSKFVFRIKINSDLNQFDNFLGNEFTKRKKNNRKFAFNFSIFICSVQKKQCNLLLCSRSDTDSLRKQAEILLLFHSLILLHEMFLT